MANLIIKPAAVGDDFKMQDANATPNTILTIEGQTEGGSAANLLGGRIIYGKGVNETKGTTSYATGTDTQTIDLATGTFFDVAMHADGIDYWEILHLPAAGTIAAWVVKLTNHGTPAINLWAGAATSTYDNSGTWSTITPAFHWAGGTDHILTAVASNVDIITFWTLGGSPSVIYSTVSGQAFAS